jgi:DNA mismatch endonuclease (patch repair protein)
MTDNLTREQRSYAMSRIRRRDTGPELRLRKALWAAGLRGYRIDRRSLPGRPDVSWSTGRVAVFVDGAFWHGHPSAFRPGKSGTYWDEKIQKNVERDRRSTEALETMGWSVLRLWDFEVKRELESCVVRISEALKRRPPTEAG